MNETIFFRNPMRKLLCGAVSNFETFKFPKKMGLILEVLKPKARSTRMDAACAMYL